MIFDVEFRHLISIEDVNGLRLQKIYNSYDKSVLSTFADAKIILSNVLYPSSQIQQSLVDRTHIWSPFNNAVLNQENDTLTMKVDTNNARKLYNRAYLPIHLNNTSREPLLLTSSKFH